MTPTEFAATLDRLGYSRQQAAEAIGCDRTTVHRILSGEMPVSGPIAHALRYHERLVTLGDVEPVAERRRGRPPKVA